MMCDYTCNHHPPVRQGRCCHDPISVDDSQYEKTVHQVTTNIYEIHCKYQISNYYFVITKLNQLYVPSGNAGRFQIRTRLGDPGNQWRQSLVHQVRNDSQTLNSHFHPLHTSE